MFYIYSRYREILCEVIKRVVFEVDCLGFIFGFDVKYLCDFGKVN